MAVELAIGYITNLLTDRAFSYLKEEIERQSGFSSKLDSLLERLLDIKRLLPIAEQKMATNQDLEKLLRDLEDAVYDAEDLLDEFAHPDSQRTSEGANCLISCLIPQDDAVNVDDTDDGNASEDDSDVHDDDDSQQVENSLTSCLPYLRQCTSGGANLLRSCLLYLSQQLASYLDVARRVITRDNSTTNITDITEKLDAISKKIVTHLKRLNLGTSHQLADDGPTATIRTETSSLPAKKMFGREEEKQRIKSMLLNSSHDDERESSTRNVLSMLPIVGMGGLGKTTLAKSVYNEKYVKEEFDLKIWVSVSEHFDVRGLTKKILQDVPGLTIEGDWSLNRLQKELQNVVMSKRLLLILDDVWDLDENESLERKWESFLAPWISLELEIKPSAQDAEEVAEISSVASKEIETEVASIKKSKIIVTTRDEKVAGIMGTTEPLRLSTLSGDIFQQLFMSCAFKGVEPRNHPPGLKETAEKIITKLGGVPLAATTVGMLLNSKLDRDHWRSILESEVWQLDMKKDDIMPALRVSYNYLPPHLKQCFAYCAIFPKDYEFDRDYLIRHWLAHGYIHPPQNRATRVEATGEEYFDDLYRRSFFQPTGEDNKYVMHDLIHDLAQSVSEHRCFRIEDQKHKQIPKTVRHLSICTHNEVALRQLESFNELKKLRTLVLYGRQFVLEMIPKLERVRVLDLYGNASEPYKPTATRFPKDIVCLKHLRYLNLSPISCSELPKEICNLHRLQVLYLPSSEEFFTKLVGLPEGFSNLINLRHLTGDRDAISRITGVHKLKDLQELEAFKVLHEHGHELSELKDMNQIRRSLMITNLDIVVDKKKAEEANLLQKKNLRELYLVWSLNNNGLADEDVIEGLQPSPSLEMLGISRYNGRSSPSWIHMQTLPNLTDVQLYDCEKWDVLPPLGQLPYLKYLELWGMHAIKIIGGHEFYGDANFPSLELLRISHMEALEEWRGLEGHQYFPSLRELTVMSCPKLRTLYLLPPKLEVLELRDVGLLSLFSSSMASGDTDGETTESSDSVSSNRLQDLHLENCPKLTTLGSFQGLVSLQELHLENCPRLQALPEELHSLSSLRELTINQCPEITSLPSKGLPLGLQELGIYNPNEELKRRCLKGEGEDWPKIQHIPTLYIRGD